MSDSSRLTRQSRGKSIRIVDSGVDFVPDLLNIEHVLENMNVDSLKYRVRDVSEVIEAMRRIVNLTRVIALNIPKN